MKINAQESDEYRFSLIVINISSFISITAKENNAQEICSVNNESKGIKKEILKISLSPFSFDWLQDTTSNM